MRGWFSAEGCSPNNYFCEYGLYLGFREMACSLINFQSIPHILNRVKPKSGGLAVLKAHQESLTSYKFLHRDGKFWIEPHFFEEP